MESDKKSNLQYWKKLQDEGYFKNHQYYGHGSDELPLFGNDEEVINGFLPLRSDMTVVIIGCGYGREAVLLSPHVKKIYGIDVNETVLQQAKAFAAKHGVANFVPVLAEEWKEKIQDSVDLVYEIVVFQHLTKDLTRDYFQGLTAKLSDTGVFLCQFMDSAYGTTDAEIKKYEPCVNWTVEDIYRLAADNNLKVVKIKDKTFPEDNATWHWALLGKRNEQEDFKKRHGDRVRYALRHELLDTAKWYIRRTDVVLDIGCGIRPQKYITPKIHYCVDAHQQYLEYLKQQHHQSSTTEFVYINAEWKDALKQFASQKVDSVFILDVIEHLPKEEGKRLLAETIKLAKEQIIIFTPLGFIHQHHDDGKDAWGMDGGKWQEHHSGWTPDDFEGDWQFLVCEDFHTHDNMNNKYETPHGAFFAILNTGAKKSVEKPLFSVIIPAYNQAKFLPEAFNSLLDQTCEHWEAVVVNDGSTDHTKEVMDAYAFQDSRFRCIHKENGGVGSALNEGITHARGEWICWLSSDDLYEKEKLELHRQYIQQFPKIKFFYTHFYYLNDETKEKTEPQLWQPIPPKEFQVTQFFIGNYVHGNSFAIHKSVFNKVGLFNTTLRQGQDFDMWLRVSAKYESLFINQRTCVTRFHPGQDTTAFVNGMYYDSCRACLDFLNAHSYEQLYPFLDLTNLHDIKIALKNTFAVALNKNSFMYYCGYIPAFIDRLNEWVNSRAPQELRQEIKLAIRNIVGEESGSLPTRLQKALEDIVVSKAFRYTAYDFYHESRRTIDEYIKEGNRKKAAEYERYLSILFNKKDTRALDFVQREKEFVPLLYGYPANGEYVQLPYENLISWKIEPITYEGLFSHEIKIRCAQCNEELLYKDHLVAEEKEQHIDIVCHKCHSAFRLKDSEIHLYAEAVNRQYFGGLGLMHASEKPSIAFVARGLSGKSGGTKIFSLYMQWLHELGAEVHVFSDTPKGDWLTLSGTFTHVKSFEEIQFPVVDYVVVYCIMDILKIIDKVPLSKIIYVCQAYEGFLYGKNFELLRKDKAMFHSLHSLPIHILAVSKHLVEFFKEHYNKTAHYIPNFVDHKIFKPNPNIGAKDNSVLFVGNPFQPLKGLDFLVTALQQIQNSQSKINNLVLNVAVGAATKEITERFNAVKPLFNFEMNLYSSLSDRMMATLINTSAVYVCASWYEGFSLSTLEAMACGTPVIVTKNMGAESFVKDGENASVVAYGDVQQLSRLILNKMVSTVDVETVSRQLVNAYSTSLEYTEANAREQFKLVFSALCGKELRYSSNSESQQPILHNLNEVKSIIEQRIAQPYPSIRITYLVHNVNSLTGGTLTILHQANALVERGHSVTIVTYSAAPAWFKLKAKVVKAPEGTPLHPHVPQSDVVISTYFLNATELLNIDAKVKIYFAQGDQYLFHDKYTTTKIFQSAHRQSIEQSERAYKLHGIKLVANSYALAELIEKRFGRKADAVLNVGIDSTIFRPVQKPISGSTLKILIVGPDTLGTEVEPLHFKGIMDAKKALLEFSKTNTNFSVIRISNTMPEIFKDFPCEFYFQPSDEVKTFLYGTADVLLYPSHYESWGLPPLEAMAAGTAVICTDNIGSKEYCVHGENCLQVPVNSPNDIAKMLERLLADEKLQKKLTQGGRVTARACTKENEFSLLENLLFHFLQEHGSINVAKYRKATLLEKKRSEISKPLAAAQQLVNAKKYADALTMLTFLDTLEQPSEEFRELIASGYSLKGFCCRMLSALNKAIQNYEKALLLNEHSVTALTGLAESYLLAAQYQKAKSVAEQALNIDSKNIPARKVLVQANKVLGFSPSDNTLLRDEIGDLLLSAEECINNNDIAQARKFLVKIILRDPFHLDALNDLSVCDIMEQKIDNALEKISTVLEIDSNNETATTNFNYIKERVTAAAGE